MSVMDDLDELGQSLPQEMRDQFTNLRELDLSVENNVDKAKKLERKLFASAKKMDGKEREAAHEEVMKHFNKAKEDADEKVEIATRTQNMILNVIKQLDAQIEKKKADLDREIPGSSERIERLSLETDGHPTSRSGKVHKYALNPTKANDKQTKKNSKSKHLTRKEKKRLDSNASSTSVEKNMVYPTSSSSIQEPRPDSASSGALVAQQQTSSLPVPTSASSMAGSANSVVPVNLGHIGPGGNAIAAAASQAIAATQQMQQGRRTASLKASYEAINTGGGVHAAEFSRELAGAAQTAIAAIQESSKKNKKKVSSVNGASTNAIPASPQQLQVQQQSPHQQQTAAAASAAPVASALSDQTGALPESRPASANSGPLVVQQQSSSVGSTSAAAAAAHAAAAAAAAAPSSGGLTNSVGPVSYNLGHIGAGGNAIAAAASQAIAATQHMQQGRRTASLKASYEAINTGGVHAAEFSRELAGAAQTAIAAIQESSKKNKKKVTSTNVTSTNVIPSSMQQQAVHQQQQAQQQTVHQQQSHQQQVHQQQAAVASATVAVASVSGHQVSATNSSATAATTSAAQANTVADPDNPDWTYDPNEPRYCICNQVSYGDMVACDNSDCPFEWFHYPCVNITAPPKGKWYCPQCTSSMKRRGGRKN
ncbi:inhibitor of growth protein 3 isoform X2 [Nasonia vitripennis]|uniref:Inhibitor of growth protein n=1 Tax=Nasonia vitripennis TaxID=7425 RepID=A0A7M7TAK4_NASVI|nr:inhibitor of growth protein 3 isoform X2 [Nasonia vitripennis]